MINLKHAWRRVKRVRRSRLLQDERGTALTEWLVLAALVIAILGGVFVNIFNRLQMKLTDVNNGL